MNSVALADTLLLTELGSQCVGAMLDLHTVQPYMARLPSTTRQPDTNTPQPPSPIIVDSSKLVAARSAID